MRTPPTTTKAANAATADRYLAAIPQDHRNAILDRANQINGSTKIAYLKAAAGKASPRQAIRAFCLECVGWERQEVVACTAPACPLYRYRLEA